MAEEQEEVTTEEAPPEETKTGIGKLMIIAFIGVVVMMETAMFFFMVPSAEQVSALAEEKLIQSVQEGSEEAEQKEEDENTLQEFSLGMFGETFSPIDTERSFRVELRLYGLIRKKNVEKMTEEFTQKEGRLRHAIRMKIRNSELSELQDNQLGLLERRILTECNHLLEEDWLLGIGFHDYQLIEE